MEENESALIMKRSNTGFSGTHRTFICNFENASYFYWGEATTPLPHRTKKIMRTAGSPQTSQCDRGF